MKIEIKHRLTGAVLFAGEFESWRLAALRMKLPEAVAAEEK